MKRFVNGGFRCAALRLLALATALLAPVSSWAASPGNLITALSVVRAQNEDRVLKIVLKDPVQGLPVTFTTVNPNRIVLDFSATGNGAGRVNEVVNAGVIASYQVLEAGERTRVVMNLTGPATYELRQDRNVILAVVRGVEAAKGVQIAASFPEVGKAKAHAIRGIDFQRGKEGESQIQVALSDPGVGVDLQQKGQAIQVDFMNTSLPERLQRRMDVTEFSTPAQTIEAFAQGQHTRLVINPKGKWDYSAHQIGNQFILTIRPLDGPNAAQTDRPQYSGEKLSLNFQNVEVRAVLQVIADFTGLNIIASDTVSGNVTLRLKDVPWDQALEIILRARGLDKRMSGNVIWVAPRDELVTKEKLELEARKSISELEPLTTRNYALNYIRADEAVSVLSGSSRSGLSTGESATCSPSATGIKAEAVSSGASAASGSAAGTGAAASSTRVLSNRGGASYDLTTNTMVVTDTVDRHKSIEAVLKNIDVPSRQVMIEARIVIADDTFSRNLGAKLGVAAKRQGGNFAASGTDATALASGTSVTSDLTTTNINLPLASSAGALGYTVLSASTNTLLSLELQALEAENRGKIVSNPRVVTTNLRPAVILQGTQIPYQTTSGTSGTQTSFKDALLCLLVSPQVLNNGDVILNVEVQKDAQGADTTAGPAINVKRVKTQVRVSNGETAILGGIFEQTLRDDVTKVPLLGDVPILGHLFKTTQKRDDKSEMLIFLTPRLLDERLTGLK
ncbi:MAG: type IV pilus secretin PilQ [Betaproteobacteria bacterium]|nr:type IV pilus secretin PilQ [Betaproteobacteria bacterium]